METDKWTFEAPTIQAALDQPLTIQDFKIVKDVLGQGGYGVVRKVLSKHSKRTFALKEINKERTKKQLKNYKETVNLELQLNYKIRHPCIARLHTHFEDQQNIYMVMELAEGIDLLDVIRKNITEREGACILWQVLNTLDHIHKFGVIHRDIKPQNIILEKSGRLKLFDFGISNYTSTPRRTFCGTQEYLAPQIISKENQSIKVDIWTVGVLAFELFAGKSPFVGQNIRQRIKLLKYELPMSFSFQLQSFIKSILKKRPQERPTIQQLLNHPFIKQKLPFKLPEQNIIGIDCQIQYKVGKFSLQELKRSISSQDLISTRTLQKIKIKTLQRKLLQISNQNIELKGRLRQAQKIHVPYAVQDSQKLKELRKFSENLLNQLKDFNEVKNSKNQLQLQLKRLQLQLSSKQQQFTGLMNKQTKLQQRIQQLQEILDQHNIEFD